MSMPELVTLLLLALGGWMLWVSLEAREAAVAASRAACLTEGYLFLDDTVAIESVWPVRDEGGQLTIRRVYAFEYSETGNDRRGGRAILIGNRVAALELAPRSAPVTRIWY